MATNAINLHTLETPPATSSTDVPAQSRPAIRVLCVDDHSMIRAGIDAIVNHQTDMSLVGAAANAHEGIQMFRKLQPDVTLMDLRLPDLGGIEALTSIRTEFQDARVLMLTTFDGDVDILRCLRAGAAGYLLKSTPRSELLAAIRNVHRGDKSVSHNIAVQLAEHVSDETLSKRETEVLRHLANGNRNKDVSRILSISEETVKAHVKHIMEKLKASDRTHAVAIAVRRGILQV